MNKLLILLLLLPACVGLDLTGVKEEIEAGRDDSVADAIFCTQPLGVFGEGECQATNVNGTILRHSIMKWSSSDVTIAQMDQDGKIIGVSVGVVTIIGIGTRGIPASVVISII